MYVMVKGAAPPVAIDAGVIRVVASKAVVWNRSFIDSSFYVLPVVNLFGACNLDMLALCCHVGDTSVFGYSAVIWFYPFSVDAFMDDDAVTGLQDVCCLLNRKKGILVGTGCLSASFFGYIINHNEPLS